MKKVRSFLFGWVILLTTVQAYAVVYDPPVYATPVLTGKILFQVPEPGVLLLLGAGLIVLVILGIRKRKRTAAKGNTGPR
jgi:hypothetical protein